IDSRVRVVHEVLEVGDGTRRALVRPEDRTVRVRIGNPDDGTAPERRRRMVATPTGETDHTSVNAVVGARERDRSSLPLGVIGDVDGRLHGIPAGDGEEDPRMAPKVPGKNAFELSEEVDARLGRQLERVPDLLRLGFERRDETRVAVSEIEDADPSHPVDEPISVHVLDGGPLGDLRSDGKVVRVSDSIRFQSGLFSEELSRARTGRRGEDPRGVGEAQPVGFRGHGLIPSPEAFVPISILGRWPWRDTRTGAIESATFGLWAESGRLFQNERRLRSEPSGGRRSSRTPGCSW